MGQRPIVLVVDDDSATRELLSTMLSLDGRFRIGGVAEDGFEGAMLAADLHPDVVILDFYMPRWDGAKAAEFIRGHCPHTKILAFSAVLDEHPDWADDFLVKTDIDRLLRLIGDMAGAATV
ncbi:MAG: response regulator [Actinomycetota bacterium]